MIFLYFLQQYSKPKKYQISTIKKEARCLIELHNYYGWEK